MPRLGLLSSRSLTGVGLKNPPLVYVDYSYANAIFTSGGTYVSDQSMPSGGYLQLRNPNSGTGVIFDLASTIAPSEAFTLEYWIRSTYTPSNVAVSVGDASAGNSIGLNFFNWNTVTSGSIIGTFYYNNSRGQGTGISVTTDKALTHVAFEVNASGQVRLYYNGSYRGQAVNGLNAVTYTRLQLGQLLYTQAGQQGTFTDIGPIHLYRGLGFNTTGSYTIPNSVYTANANTLFLGQ